MAFKKGQSGNPSGRPKVAENLKQRALTAVDEVILDAWIDECASRGKDWVKCSELLAGYGLGKPAQQIQHADPDGKPMQQLAVVFIGNDTED